MPRSIKAARALMFVVSGLAVLLVVLLLPLAGISAASLAVATWMGVPAAANLWLAFKLPSAGIGMRRAIIALEAFYIFLALGTMGQGNPQGVTSLLCPIAVLVLVTRPSATRFFRTPKPG